jgi:hypothetical protein
VFGHDFSPQLLVPFSALAFLAMWKKLAQAVNETFCSKKGTRAN